LQLFNQKLLSIAREVAFRNGERLVRQGEPSRGAFVLRDGKVEALVALPAGGMLAVAELGAGEMFGEMALIERGVCTASVVARSEVSGWFIEREDFRAMVASRDPAALEIQRTVTRVLAQKLRTLNARVREHPAAEDRPAVQAKPGERSEASFDWRAFLPILPFFETFDPYERDEFIKGCSAFELPRGAALFNAGDAASACFLVIRGAVEVVSTAGDIERRVALAGPGELLGHLAVLEGRAHGASARVRESACLMEFPAAQFLGHYQGGSGTSVSLQQAIHKSLLRALGRTNTQLTRLISHARLTAERGEAADLEKALHGQIVQSSSFIET
jgi:CRP-like cAMP-binding protein